MVAILALASCSSVGSSGGLSSGANQRQTPVERTLSPNPQGEVIGNGSVRIALLVPKSIPGGAAAVASELRNGAEMAMQDFGQQRLQLVVKDTKGQAATSQTLASEAVKEGASLILGPLFAANVSAASGITQPANVPILAFSTDTSVARRGVYLFSYTPQSDTQRIVNYAASLGRRSIFAFLPANAEGNLRERVLREEASRNGIRVNSVKYSVSQEGVNQVVTSSSAEVQVSDAIYIPDGGAIPNAVLSGLTNSGVGVAGKLILGSGKWETVNTRDVSIKGAVYPGRDISRFNEFANRYRSKYGTTPGVNAALSYDAVTFASELVRMDGARAFSTKNIESQRGFQGTNGLFRIKSNGITERGLAIYRIEGGRGVLAEPAVSNFRSGS